MPTYDLYHTETGALIRSQVFAAQPANPAGKPWAWALQSKPADEVGSVVQWSTAGRDWVSVAMEGAPLNAAWAARGAAAKERIEKAAEGQRMRYLTGGTGKAMTYQAKHDEARAYAADPDPQPADYPFAAAEAAVRGITLAAMIGLWQTNIAAWATVLGPAIEAAEHQAKLSVDTAVAAKDAAALAAAGVVAWPANG